MASSLTQLHITPMELATFVGTVAKRHGLSAVLLRFRPNFSSEVAIDLTNLANEIDLEEGQHVVLLTAPPELRANNQLEFYDKNPNFISFHFGSWRPEGLRQSTVGYKTDDPATMALGKKVLGELKKITKAGVRIINPDSGASGEAKTFRYTDGALALEKSGVQMLPLAGGNLVKLGL